jgi:Uma2 family endonuclease
MIMALCYAEAGQRGNVDTLTKLRWQVCCASIGASFREVAMGVSADSWIKRRQITVDEYYRMGKVGLIGPDERVELIEGEIIDMAPIGSDHASFVIQLTNLLVTAVKDKGFVSVQNPIRLSSRSEPEPDFAVLKPRADFYRKQLPTAADTLLVVEVCNTSERYDREIKLPLYAAHGIPEVWLISIEQQSLTIYRSLANNRYQQEQTTQSPSAVSLSALPDITVDLSALF